ncbi:ATP-dependent RNA helicase DbpA [Alkalilimnicola sp. S0819]|uniref:ATP-dependent RNA helicase DbpA n=1 Tax=Alkalilimnicola sp. S0819 TaxID=2613922 RepID=UPI001261EB9B|nr:ATP-dependent RNA helicase DbpA [Alkalilimnicola sp. S0819]KAB7627151.1 ATP-dependent RNA helicase DbpA [Alkalilimnicola sp. S0819]MPQ15860.1 ATP-dependent RNA helicase DbpA [Alkalilimnicola sp. S0819]
MTDFGDLGLPDALLSVLAETGYASPTPIQRLSLPPLLAGQDLIAQSRTGSGKTAAFAIPLLTRVDAGRRELQALVLCPTRDLCAQVAGEIRKLGRYQPNLQVLIVCGGQPPRPQAQALERGVQVVVATPGRLLDHLERGRLMLDGVRTLVLDEADRMLDMGFREDIARILAQTPPLRQTALFSATFDEAVLELSAHYQRAPQRVAVSDAPPAIAQWRQEVAEADRLSSLISLLRAGAHESAIVFCNRKLTVDTVAEQLRRAGLPADRLHGGLEQRERDLALTKFRNGSTRVLVATDVAARGLDIAGLAAVVNYELPGSPEVYVHRIGRTGRAGAQGLAVTLHGPGDAERIKEIEQYTGTPIPYRRPEVTEAGAETAEPALKTLSIGGGRKDKIRPGDILGALTGEAGLRAEQVGRIEITDKLSFVALHADCAGRALVRLREGRIKGRRFRVELLH